MRSAILHYMNVDLHYADCIYVYYNILLRAALICVSVGFSALANLSFSMVILPTRFDIAVLGWV